MKRFLPLILLGACGVDVKEPERQAQNVSPPLPPMPEILDSKIGICWEYNKDENGNVIPNLWYIARMTEKPGGPVVRTGVTQSNSVSFDAKNGKAYFMTVTAKDDQGFESGPSEMIGYKVPRLQMLRNGTLLSERPINRANVDYLIEATTDFQTWDIVLTKERVLSTIDGVETIEHQLPTTQSYLFFRGYLRINPEGCAS